MRHFIALLAFVGAFAAAVAVSAQESDPVAVLKSNASLEAKSEALRVLSVEGGPDAIPVLASLLTDEKLSHMARYALEPMPYPEAGEALRAALNSTAGPLRVGVIGSLALRRDEAAVPELVKLLADGDEAVAQAAAAALGAIATPEAEKALVAACTASDAPEANIPALCDGVLACAEKRVESGQREEAVALYEALLGFEKAPEPIRVAALRGALLHRDPEDARNRMTAALAGDDAAAFASVLRVARELPRETEAARALAEALPNLSDERKVRVLDTLGAGDGEAAGSAALAEAEKGSTEVQVAALRALTRMEHTPALERIQALALGPDGPLATAARRALAYFPGDAGDAVLKTMLKDEEARVRRIAVELIGQGGLDEPLSPLTAAAQSDADVRVRVAALEGLRDYAGLEELSGIVRRNLIQGETPAEIEAAERALAALCERQKQMPIRIEIREARYGVAPDGPWVDVREAVEQAVASGLTSVEASNARFGDPAYGVTKELRVEYVDRGEIVRKSAREGESLSFASVSAPPAIVDAFRAALDEAQGEARLSVLRLLGAAGGSKALDAVKAAADSNEAAVRDTARRTLCAWPTPDALPEVLELAKAPSGSPLKTVALGGAVRMLGQSGLSLDAVAAHYADLMNAAQGSPDETKLVLSGLAQVPHPKALELALASVANESVRAEAVLAATAIAPHVGGAAREDDGIFNGVDLKGWEGDTGLWRVEEGAVVGQSTQDLTRNEFVWSSVEVGDFYLVVDVMLEPNTANAGIQFRSEKIDERGQARGYQADMGQDVWGRLYHEQGRGKLDWNDRGEKAVKPGEWNRYEILAVGPAIWTAVNGQLAVACVEPDGERTGGIAFQLHAGPPSTARYRIVKLVHNPKVEIAGLGPEQLIGELRRPEGQ